MRTVEEAVRFDHRTGGWISPAFPQVACILAVLLAACTDGNPVDAGLPDAGAVLDGGAIDAGLSDAGTVDGGAGTDSGLADAGASDGGAHDAGVADAGATDGGNDAGTPDAGCPIDLGCGLGQLCTFGVCVLRIGSSDAGFSCNQACDCLEGQLCADGGCVPDPIVPTGFFGSGESGLGLSSNDPAGNLSAALAPGTHDVALALRANDAFSSTQPFSIDGSRVQVLGGYRQCTRGRWVRDPDARSTLEVDGGTVIRVAAPSPGIEDVSLMGLELRALHSCVGDQLEASNVTRLQVANLRAAFRGPTCPATSAIVRCDYCPEVLFRDVSMGVSGVVVGVSTTSPVFLIHTYQSSGLIERTKVLPQPGPLPPFTMIRSAVLVGPMTIRDSELPNITTLDRARGIEVYAGGNHKLEITGNRIGWADAVLSVVSSNTFAGIEVGTSDNISIVNNVIDGRGSVGQSWGLSKGIATSLWSGAIVGNTIWISDGQGVATYGIEAGSARIPAALIANNSVRGGGASQTVTGILFDRFEPDSARVARNFITVTAKEDVRGIEVRDIARGVVTVDDNTVDVRGLPGCSTPRAEGLRANNVRLRLEGNRLRAEGGRWIMAGASLLSTSAELSSNHLTAGNGCNQPTRALSVEYSEIVMRGNSIEALGDGADAGVTGAVRCRQGSIVGAENNILGGGAGSAHFVLEDDSGLCSNWSVWRSNYLFVAHPSGQLSPGDSVSLVHLADAGTRDPNNNLFNSNVSCFADAGTYRLAQGSPCVDTGQLLFRADGGLIEFDVDGQSRLDAGLPDVGAFELH